MSSDRQAAGPSALTPGFYWIQDPDGSPEPAYWGGERWILLGLEGAADDEPIVLSETPITPPG